MPAGLRQTMGGVFILGSSPGCSSHPVPVRKEGFKSELRPFLGLALKILPNCLKGPGKISWVFQISGTSPCGTHLILRKLVLEGLKHSAFGVLEARPGCQHGGEAERWGWVTLEVRR